MKTDSKLRVAVLFGGESHEREISLESGRNVCYKLSPARYELLPLFANQEMRLFHIPPALLVRNRTEEIASLVDETMEVTWSSLPKRVDFVFIALHGGKGEGGAVQGALEMLNIPYNGSNVLASALCMDKHRSAQFLRAEGFDTPIQKIVAQNEWQNDRKSVKAQLESELTVPLVVKPYNDGCSTMVGLARDWKAAEAQIDQLFAQNKDKALVEQLVTGMELTVGLLGNDTPRALPPSYSVSTGDILSIEEKFLPGQGENQTPAPITPEATAFVQETLERAYRVLGLSGYARIDCFYQTPEKSPTGEQRLVILEVNTLPGLTPSTCLFHQAAEIDLRPADLLDKIIEFGLERHHTSAHDWTQSHAYGNKEPECTDSVQK